MGIYMGKIQWELYRNELRQQMGAVGLDTEGWEGEKGAKRESGLGRNEGSRM